MIKMKINYIEDVVEMDNMIFDEKFYDYDFIDYVSYLHKKYIDKKFNLSLEDMEEKFEEVDEDKKVFAKIFKLEYARINDLEYLGNESIEFAREYLQEIQSLPQKS